MRFGGFITAALTLAVSTVVVSSGTASAQKSATKKSSAADKKGTRLKAPANLRVKVPKYDDGRHIDVSWDAQSKGDEVVHIVVRADSPKVVTFAPGTKLKTGFKSFVEPNKKAKPGAKKQIAWEVVAIVTGGAQKFRDTVSDRKPHFYMVIAARAGTEKGQYLDHSKVVSVGPITTKTAPFHFGRLFFLFIIVTMGAGLVYFLKAAKRDPSSVYIRRIPGVDAIEDAVGRSTEMGRPVLYVTGIEEIQNIQTIASLLVLARVSEMTAEYDTEIKVANYFPLTMVVAEEIVKQGFANAGRVDAHKPENVMFIAAEQFAFAAGVNGIILRDKPATNIYLGRFFAESLILAETGYVTKAVQIAGTAEITQLPFFIAACDYTIIGEELYAVSAYLSREPTLLATLKSTDMIKVLVIGIVGVGAVVSTMGALGVSIGGWTVPYFNLGHWLIP